MTDPDERVQLTFVASAEGGFPIIIHPMDSSGEEQRGTARDSGDGHHGDDDSSGDEPQQEQEEIRIGSLEVSPR